MTSKFGETANYFWNINERLGEGAAGVVYKCRHKLSGEMFAAKTMTAIGRQQPIEVQRREFDVLLKLKHENIVRLIDFEVELNNFSGYVLIMELCAGQSLLHKLTDPENAHGLSDVELVRLVCNLAAGVEHLRQKEIVHRDIKPGNILCTWDTNSQPIYKLTDFGAARELKDDENFQSLVGTVEYLSPDMYLRAVLNPPNMKKDYYTARVDLWSLGITIYQAATGQLPFQPYGGARHGKQNEELMYRMTSQKESGIISGIQRTFNGPVEWSDSLPSCARLSQGLARIITPILAGTMESSASKQWDFAKFFAATKDLSVRRAARVLYLPDVSLHTLYLSEWSVSQLLLNLQDIISCPIDDLHVLDTLSDQSQFLSLDTKLPSYQLPDKLFFVTGSQLFLKPEARPFPLPDEICNPPDGLNLDMDVRYAKQCIASLYQFARLCAQVELRQLGLCEAASGGSLHSAVRRTLNELHAPILSRTCYSTMQHAEDLLRILPASVFHTANIEPDVLRQHIVELKSICEQMTSFANQYYQKIVMEDELSKKWTSTDCSCCRSENQRFITNEQKEGNLASANCSSSIKIKLVTANQIQQRFRDDRNLGLQISSKGNSAYQLLHKHDKNTLLRLCQSAKQRLYDCCFNRLIHLHKHYCLWAETSQSVTNKIYKLKDYANHVVVKQSELENLCRQLSSASLSSSGDTCSASASTEVIDSNAFHRFEKQLQELHVACDTVKQAMVQNCQVINNLVKGGAS